MPLAPDSSLRSGGLVLKESPILIANAVQPHADRIPVLRATATSAPVDRKSLPSNVKATGLHSSAEKAGHLAANSGRAGLGRGVRRAGRAAIARLSSLVDPNGRLNAGADLKVLRAAVRLVAPHPGVVRLVVVHHAVDLLAASPVRLSGLFGSDLSL